MKLTATKRVLRNKSEVKRIRREGGATAVLYSKQPSKNVAAKKVPGGFIDNGNIQLIIKTDEFSAILRDLKPGHLPNTVFDLEIEGVTKKVVIKALQYGPTDYSLNHFDFEELKTEDTVRIKIPVECTGVSSCKGIKNSGGFLRQVKRHIQVECKPNSIPSAFVIDVTDMDVNQSKRLKDLELPAGVRALANADDVIVVIAKKRA